MDLLLGFVLGMVTSTIVGGAFYWLQKRESFESHREILLLFSSQNEKFDELQQEVQQINEGQSDLGQEYKQIKGKITKALRRKDIKGAQKLTNQYKDIANQIAESHIDELDTSVLKVNNLNPIDIKKLHNDIFPKDYKLGGIYRSENATFSMYGGSNSSMTPSHEVPEKLTTLLNNWNAGYKGLMEKDKEEKIEVISNFHNDFLSIHPFFDGNGRVARLIMKLQIKALLDEDVSAKVLNYKKYIKALKEADLSKVKPLFDYITNFVGITNKEEKQEEKKAEV